MQYLKRIEDVLPDVERGVGVSEGEDYEFVVDTQDAFNVLLVFLDVVRMERFVGIVAYLADPVDQILGSSHDQRVGE